MREFKFKIYDKNDAFGTQGIIGPFAWNKLPQFLYPKNFTVLQYTGLKDSQGNEIYEGDIVDAFYEYDYEEPWGGSGRALDDFNGVVEYDASLAMFFVRSPMLHSGRKNFSEIRLSKTSVIGNIFENPELLKA